MKKVVFVTGSLSDGGAEKVMSILASKCADMGNEVTLVVLRNKKIVYPVSSNVNLIHFNFSGKMSVIKKIRELHKVLKEARAQAVIPFLSEISLYTLIANIGVGTKYIFSVRADPNISMKGHPLKTRISHFIMYSLKVHEKADWTVFQTPDAQAYFPERVQRKSSVIANPLNTELLPQRFEGIRKPRIVAAGRFSDEKNFELLLNAFSKFVKIHPEYSLELYGEGSLRTKYQEMLSDLQIEGKVSMPGFVSDLQSRMYDAAMYVSTSNHEGISNSMLEALGMGVPSIVTDCPVGGARMFVKTGENGILIPMNDEEALIKAMEKISENDEFARTISINATKIREDLSAERICEQWLKLV